MTTDAVRSLIREILAEELGRISRKNVAKPSPTQERVSVDCNDDLQKLVQHILKLSHDKSMRDRLVRGKHVFVLESTPGHRSHGKNSPASPASTAMAGDIVQIKEGFLSERRVETLPRGTRVVQLGRRVRFTPLARDRLRQRKIAVERIK